MYNLSQSVPQYVQHPMGYGWFPTQQQVVYPSNQMQVPLSNQRQSVPLSFDSSIPQGLQGYAPLQSYQAGAGSYAQQPQYHPPRSGLVTPYNEPRTPYNEPRSPANELSHWGERQAFNMQYATKTSPPKNQAKTQRPGQDSRPRALERSNPVAPPMIAGRWDFRPAGVPQQQQQEPPREDFVMTPNGSLARVPAVSRNNMPSRYDPDEAEARVRSLIADTERMLVGLSNGGSEGPGLAV